LREEDGEGDWEDEERDTVSQPKKRGSGGAGRKQNAWTAATAGLFGQQHGGASGTSTPDDRSERGEEAAGKSKRPGAQRRTSAWGAVKQKLVKPTNRAPKEKAGETLAGSELVAVSGSRLSVIFVIILLIYLPCRRNSPLVSSLWCSSR
jgi:hypothetical protein